MKKPLIGFLTVMFLLLGCTLVNNVTGGQPATPAGHPAGSSTSPPPGTSTSTASPLSAFTSTVAGTAAAPSDVVVVDTPDQETFPFNQDGNCSLGEAIQTVLLQQAVDACVLPPGSQTVYLPTGTYTLTEPDDAPVVLFGKKAQSDREHFDPAGFPMIANTLIILGNGSNIQRTGPAKFGIFQVFVGGSLTLKELTISGGDATANNGGDDGGGAISVAGGSLTLDHVTLSHNVSKQGGALMAGGSVTLMDSTITQNSSTGEGGGIYNDGQLVIKSSVISSNSAAKLYEGGGIYSAGQLTLDHSQVLGNTANTGGGIYNSGGSVAVTNQSVISGNVATWENNGGDEEGGGGIESRDEDDQLTIDQSFIIGNWADDAFGGGLLVGGQGATIKDSVLAGNAAGSGSAIEYVDGQASLTGNCIVDNRLLWAKGTSGVENDSMDSHLDAIQNWWGTSGASTWGDVTTAPLLTTAPAICASPVPTAYPTASAP